MSGSRIAACLALALALSGAGAARAADTLIPLEVGTMPGDASAEVYYGVEQGFFKAEGLDVHITGFTNAPAQAAAVIGGHDCGRQRRVGSVAVARERGILERVIAPASVYDPKALTAVLMWPKIHRSNRRPNSTARSSVPTGCKIRRSWNRCSGLKTRRGSQDDQIRRSAVPAMAGALQQHRIEAALMVERADHGRFGRRADVR